MKNFVIAFVMVVALSNASVVSAAEDGSGLYLTLGHNWFDFDKTNASDNDNGFYAGFGVKSSEHLGLEFKYSEYDDAYVNLSGIYRLKSARESSFFWKAGLGIYTDREERTNNFNLGGGYEAYIDDKTSFVFGVDTIWSNDNHQRAIDLVPHIGFTYLIGEGRKKAYKKTKQAPKPVVLDSDNDGVIDSADQCPDTAAGAAVDSNGCELDGDKDGIVDRLDSCLETPLGAKIDDKGCRIILTEDVSIKLNVQFANNSNVVTDEYRTEVKKVADFMSQYPDTSVVIEGHTDSRGKASYNESLSERRATAVMQYLVSEFGIDQSRVSASGKGEVSPIADNATAEGRAANRRVQAEIKTSVSKPQ